MNLLTRALLWLPRVMAMAFALFLAMFATDVFLQGGSFIETSGAFISHLLPAASVILLVVLGWRRDGLAAIGFGALAVAFFVALSGWSSPPAFMLFALPPVGIGLAYFARMRLLANSRQN